MKDLVDLFSDLPDEYLQDDEYRDRNHDPLDDEEGDCWEPFDEDWRGDLDR